eukprot:889939_1
MVITPPGNSGNPPTNVIAPPTNVIAPPTNVIAPPTNVIAPPTNVIAPSAPTSTSSVPTPNVVSPKDDRKMKELLVIIILFGLSLMVIFIELSTDRSCTCNNNPPIWFIAYGDIY